jgi:microcystin-dependent protein
VNPATWYPVSARPDVEGTVVVKAVVVEEVGKVGDCSTEETVELEEVGLTAEWHEVAATTTMVATSTTLGSSTLLRR